MATLPRAAEYRKADYEVLDLFVHRWSPRAMSGEALSEAELQRLFEAARWAPSSYNEQPWRILYTQAGSPQWPVFFDLLWDPNKAWCARAAVLLLFVSSKVFARNHKPNPVHVYDCGSAWENLALQASAMGLVAHGMAGFSPDQARTALQIPDAFDICAMAALGRPGDPDLLPEDFRKMEIPCGRRPIRESFFEGAFPASG